MSSKRAIWNNSTDLRESIEEDLINWAWWSYGGLPDLGHAHKSNFVPAKRGSSPAIDVEKAEAVEDTLVMWRLIAKQADQLTRLHMADLLRVMKVHFLSPRPVEVKRKFVQMSRKKYYQMLDDALYRFWVLHY